MIAGREAARVEVASKRRFTLIDAMALVAATGVGFALARPGLVGFLNHFSRNWAGASRLVAWIEVGTAWSFGLAPVTIVWAAALIFLRVRPPRPARRRLSRQPGFTACVALVVGPLMLSILLAAIFAIHPQAKVFGDEMILWTDSIGWPVAAVWVVQAQSGRWRPVPDWIDRFGRALGACWIVGPTVVLTAYLIARHWL